MVAAVVQRNEEPVLELRFVRANARWTRARTIREDLRKCANEHQPTVPTRPVGLWFDYLHEHARRPWLAARVALRCLFDRDQSDV